VAKEAKVKRYDTAISRVLYILALVVDLTLLLLSTQGCDVDGGGPTQIELLSSDDRDCRLFTSLLEEGSFAAGQVLLLTDLAEGCPCAESEVRLNTFDFSSDVSVCGSGNDHGPLAYQNYCAEQYSSVQNALNGNIYKAAYAEFVDLVERLAQDEALSAYEKYQQTQQAFDALPSTDNTYYAEDCLNGCALFVARYCCEDSIG
jgi:hypothetical protein